VRKELEANGFRNDPAKLRDRVVTEVAYAIWPPAHEDTQPGYGAIITDSWQHHRDCIPDVYVGETLDCADEEKGRTFADGDGSFFVCDGQAHKLWVPSLLSFSTEAALFSLRDEVLFNSRRRQPHVPSGESDFVIVQRSVDGVVLIMHWDGLIVMRDGAWSSRTYQYGLLVEERLKARDSEMSEQMADTIRSLLAICLHVLSPRRCGATILAAFDHDPGLESCLGSKNAFDSPVRLTVRRRSNHGPIAHVLAQRDGAALVGETGQLRSIGHWLTPPEDSLKQTASLGGSRQLTARATSTRIRSPIFTVSSEGPVRIYHRGELIATTEPFEEHLRPPH